MKTILLVLILNSHHSLDSIPVITSLHDSDIDTVLASFKTKNIVVKMRSGESYTYSQKDWGAAMKPGIQLPSKLDQATGLLDRTFTKTEVAPSFPGGEVAWQQYVEKISTENKKLIKKYAPVDIGVQFIVGFDGTVENVELIGYDIPQKLHDLAINMIKEGPDWIPATQNGRVVTCYKKIQIHFE